ncbi:unnamed protein product [Rotaria magnacalcarata]|nr:unnamed protein product [Rotaria magnacalcarata]CAF2050716.1 unnamed protein product [Rotaria magnacalcarata]CAF2145723.1 unnamed protein product [Rotaria magnacalcarata]CAF3806136.1 unnamed protein product [Rotaria magnacalcarata]CAF3957936.1 unnamed protein product [Rotaria magnacalcarata]
MRSSSNRSTNRTYSEQKNSPSTFNHYRSMPSIFKIRRPSKKQLSVVLNTADFEICQAPNENEMFEGMQNSNNNTNQSDSITSDDTITDQCDQPSSTYSNHSPTTTNKKFSISQIKNRLIPQRCENTKKDENHNEKNNGFLFVDQIDTDLVLIQTDTFDQQSTRHPEPCGFPPIYDDNMDINQMQLIPTTPVTPNLLPPEQPSLASPLLHVANHSSHELDIQATQAGVECATPLLDELGVHDTQLSATNSSSSTNSSNNDPRFNVDRSTLDDYDYVQGQKNDLERITLYEIDLNDDLRYEQQSLYSTEKENIEFNHNYKAAKEINVKFQEELKKLEILFQQQERLRAPWTCEVCTFFNKPYIETLRDVCEMCEGPSPLKRYTLTN